MNEITTTKVLVIIAVIFVTAALVTLPYQNQVADAAPPAKRYQVYVTLTDVPTNAEDLIVNVTISRGFGSVVQPQITTVTSPSEGDDVGKFVFRVPSGSNEDSVRVCGNTDDFSVSSCELYPLPSQGGGPIRVDYSYPT